jgi:hypothetical protein
MGRPLKIAKAQAVLTITDTTAATDAITVSQSLTTLGVIAGMPFVVATTVGGLTAATTYWVLQVIDANNFTASATDLSANITSTPVALSDTTGGSVSASVGVVDAYFNNPVSGAGFPATNANTYGVVGGNTAIIGNQVLCNVAFGANGTGTIIASTSSNVVVGVGTDLANVAAGTILFAVYGAGTGPVTLVGTTSATGGDTTVAVANTQATGNFVRTSGNAQTLVVDGPVAFSANLGGLLINTTYWVKAVANATAFTVATTPGGTAVTLTNATGTPNATQQQVVLTDVAANPAIGVTSQGDPFIQALPEAGFILRQKGKTKYLVQGTVTGLVGAVYTANVANTALTPNTMSIISTDAASGTAYVSSVNDYNSEVFPAQVAAGSLSAGTTYTIYNSGNTDWSLVGAASNMTGVSFVATAAGSGTGTAVLNTVNPDVIATFNTAYAANTYGGQPNPIVDINAA